MARLLASKAFVALKKSAVGALLGKLRQTLGVVKELVIRTQFRHYRGRDTSHIQHFYREHTDRSLPLLLPRMN